MKHFETPDIEIIKFKVEEIMTNSNELPFVPYAINEDELELTIID